MSKQTNLKISVIIPVYNGEKYIEQCIQQLQEQDKEIDCEFLFINDGSTDYTLDIICKYAQNDSRIKHISQENSGVSAARNRGLSNAIGEWIVFVDVDDVIDPQYLYDINLEISHNPSASMLVYARHYINKDSRIIDTSKFTKKDLICSLLTEKPISELGTDFLLFAVWSKAYKRDFLTTNHIKFVEKLKWAEDLIFQCLAFQYANEIKFIYRGYYRYVQNSDSTIHTLREDDCMTMIKIQQETQRALSPLWNDDDIQSAYYTSMLIRWFIAIPSELGASKETESSIASYSHFKRIMKEALIQEVLSKVNPSTLDSKNKVKLFLLKHLPFIYFIMIKHN